MRLPFAVIVVALAVGLPQTDSRPIEVIRPEQAKDHLDQTCAVLMVVRSSKNEMPQKVVYLDSEEDYRDKKNLAIVIDYSDLKKFAKVGIEDPAAYFKGKKIRVTGKIIREEEQTRIRVTEPSQISLKEIQEKQVP
jgi:hypothetical protein